MKARHLTAAAALVLVAALTACDPGSSGSGDASSSPSPSTTTSSDETDTPSPTPSATPTTEPIALPTDCRAILSADVLSQLGDTPLNDAAFGPSGVGADGTLTCIWRYPQADTTGLITKISYMNRGPALEMLNALADNDGFSCFTPDGGTRCEKTWANAQYPVTDGRTLFWRDDILIDTNYSNLAPTGYTASIIASVFG
ncbi:hypothetical protein [Microbacterium sp. NPDC087665]|uniref:hypothetical protein n=1 Tax=Microbacterium sp. NPDC087665 TaxID=3364194 RepID=UPI00382A1139